MERLPTAPPPSHHMRASIAERSPLVIAGRGWAVVSFKMVSMKIKAAAFSEIAQHMLPTAKCTAHVACLQADFIFERVVSWWRLS